MINLINKYEFIDYMVEDHPQLMHLHLMGLYVLIQALLVLLYQYDYNN